MLQSFADRDYSSPFIGSHELRLGKNVPLHGPFHVAFPGAGGEGKERVKRIEPEKVAMASRWRAGAAVAGPLPAVAPLDAPVGNAVFRDPGEAGRPLMARGGLVSRPSQVCAAGMPPPWRKALLVR